MGTKIIAPCRGLVFCTQFKNTFALSILTYPQKQHLIRKNLRGLRREGQSKGKGQRLWAGQAGHWPGTGVQNIRGRLPAGTGWKGTETGRKAKSKIRRTIITKTGGCSSECPPDLFGESGKIISCFLERTMIYCYYPDLRSLSNMRQGILK